MNFRKIEPEHGYHKKNRVNAVISSAREGNEINSIW